MTAVGALLLTSFPRKRESICSYADEVKMDYARLLPRAVPAIRFANVRSGILPPQSRLRGNDELVGAGA
jgi:hypothetical protein